MERKDIFLDFKFLSYKFLIPCACFERSPNERGDQRAKLCHRAVPMQTATVGFLSEHKLTHYQSFQNSYQEYAQENVLRETKLEMRSIPLSFLMLLKR